MRTLRLMAALTWALASLFGATASACDHAAEATVETDAHASAHHGMPDGAMPDGSMPDDCEPDCCDGACACEGVTVAAALLPEAAQGGAFGVATTARPGDTAGTASHPAREGPPPRLL